MKHTKPSWLKIGSKVYWRGFDWTVTDIGELSGCVELNGIDMLLLRAPFGELVEVLTTQGDQP